MTQTIVGLFLDSTQARKVASELGRLGIPEPQIDVLDAYVTGLNDRLDRAGVPSADVAIYAEGVRRGGALVVASVSNQLAEKAGDLMDDHGAADIEDFPTEWTAPPLSAPAPEPAKVQLRDETALVPAPAGRVINGGDAGLQVRDVIVETPVEQTVQLIEEHVSVERRPANRIATATDFEAFEQGVIELVELAEEVVITKKARVIEEVVITKRVRERPHTVKETLKQTHLTMSPGAVPPRHS